MADNRTKNDFMNWQDLVFILLMSALALYHACLSWFNFRVCKNLLVFKEEGIKLYPTESEPWKIVIAGRVCPSERCYMHC